MSGLSHYSMKDQDDANPPKPPSAGLQSRGQGQGPKAERLLADATQNGSWVGALRGFGRRAFGTKALGCSGDFPRDRGEASCV